MTYHIGEKVHGRITGIQPYGAFVTLDNQTQGLIHISECHEGYVRSINDYLHVGDQVQVMVLDIDEFSGKISLSLRCMENEPQTNIHDLEIYKGYHHKHYWTNKHVHAGFQPIAAHMDDWVSASLHRLDNL